VGSAEPTFFLGSSGVVYTSLGLAWTGACVRHTRRAQKQTMAYHTRPDVLTWTLLLADERASLN